MKILTLWLLGALAFSVSASAQTVIKQPDPQASLVSLSSVGTKINKNITGLIVTSTGGPALNNTITSYTVGSGNVFYLSYVDFGAMIKGVTVTTAQDLGYIYLQSGSSNVLKQHMPAYQGAAPGQTYYFAEPIPFPAGTVINATSDALYNGSTEWRVNFGGYER